MDQAKAVINLNEGIIQLEGPVEFVQRYLERYAPAMKGAPTPEPQAAAPETKAEARGKPRGARGSCTRAIRAEIKAGFFDEPKSNKAVRERLGEKGIVCSQGLLRTTLRKAVEKGRLRTTGRGRGTVYTQDSGGKQSAEAVASSASDN